VCVCVLEADVIGLLRWKTSRRSRSATADVFWSDSIGQSVLKNKLCFPLMSSPGHVACKVE